MDARPIALLVEDDPEAAGDYKEDIEGLIDVTVIAISPPPADVLDLLALVEEHHADAVILDHVLPQRSDATYLGIDAFEYLRDAFPGLPTIILTAFPDKPELKRRGLPWDDFIKKRDFDEDETFRAQFLRELYQRMRVYRQTQDELHSPLEPSTTVTESLVERLARRHFKTEDTVEAVVWLTGADETEIRLIEINRTALPSETLELFRFAPSEDVPFPTLIADVTPKDWDKIQRGDIALPQGWDLESATVFWREEHLLREEEEDGLG